VQQGKQHHYWKGWNGIWIHLMTFAIKITSSIAIKNNGLQFCIKTISSREIVIKKLITWLYMKIPLLFSLEPWVHH
jgi:hypothetical protein